MIGTVLNCRILRLKEGKELWNGSLSIRRIPGITRGIVAESS